MTYEL